MTDHRAQALNNPNVYDANMHALVYLGDQVKRIADTLDGQTFKDIAVDTERLKRILARKGLTYDGT